MTAARHAAPTRRRTRPTPDASAGRVNRWRDWLSGLGALLLLLAFVAGIPALLVAVAGIPFSHGLPSWTRLSAQLHGPDDGELLQDVLLCLAWAGWAIFTLLAALETVALARQTVAPTLVGLGALQPAIGRLIAAIALLLPAATTALHLSGTVAPRIPVTAPLRPAATNPTLTTNTVAARTQRTFPSIPPAAATMAAEVLPVYVVGTDHTGARDTLWTIAQRHLGNPLRWREIAELNSGQLQPDGGVFTDPNLIRPGWKLRLPVDATGLPANTPAPAPAPDRPHAEPPLTPVPAPQVAPADPAKPRLATPSPDDNTPTPTPSPASTSDPAPSKRSTSPPSPKENRRTGSIALGTGSEISLALAAAVLAAWNLKRRRRRRHYQPQAPCPARFEGHPTSPPPLRELLSQAAPLAETSDDTANFWAAVTARRGWDLAAGDSATQIPWTTAPVLQLAGGGAADAARSLIATALLDHPGTTDVLAAGLGLEDLLPGAAASPYFQHLPSVAAAVEQLQLEVIHRTRTLFDADIPDAATYRNVHPEDPFPALLLVLDQPPSAHPALSGLVADNAHLDIAALILNSAATEGSLVVEVSTDGHAAGVQPAALAPELVGRQLQRLTDSDAAILLAAAIDTGEDDPPRRSPPSKHPPDETSDGAEETHWVAGTETTPSDQRPPVRVQLLANGPMRIWVHDDEISTGLRSTARQLLAWFLLHPQGRSIDTAVTSLWLDAPAGRVSERFWTALGNLRSRLTLPDGTKPPVLTKTAGAYQPEPGLFDVDLWTFQAALQRATDASDDTTKFDALRAAVEVYQGPFAVDDDYLWADFTREELHHKALDAHIAYAELLAARDGPASAIPSLERARGLDPDAEDIYRRLMRAHNDAGHKHAALAVWKQLNRRLIDLDVEPDPETSQLYRRIRGIDPRTAAVDHAKNPFTGSA